MRPQRDFCKKSCSAGSSVERESGESPAAVTAVTGFWYTEGLVDALTAGTAGLSANRSSSGSVFFTRFEGAFVFTAELVFEALVFFAAVVFLVAVDFETADFAADVLAALVFFAGVFVP